MFVISLILVLMFQVAGSEMFDFEIEILVEGLDYFWVIVELFVGEFLIIEKFGVLCWYYQGQLQFDLVSGILLVLYGGQGGLFDIVVYLDYQINQLVYLIWFEGVLCDNVLVFGCVCFEDGVLVDLEILFIFMCCSIDVYYGVCLVFMMDGIILLGLGDGFDLCE